MLRHQFHAFASPSILNTVDHILEVISQLLDVNTIFLARNDDEKSEIISVLNRKEVLLQGDGPKKTNQLRNQFIVDQNKYDLDELIKQSFFKEITTSDGAKLGAFLGVPVTLKTGEVFGTLCALDEDNYKFQEKDISLFRTMASLLSQVIELEWLYKHDSLTYMYNRNFLLKYFERSSVDNDPIALLSIDLDRFKLINDTAGHEVGDKLLQCFADRLYGAVRKEDIVIRTGGDEFAVIAHNLRDKEEIRLNIEKLQAQLAESYMVYDNEYRISTTIGISLFPEDTDDLTTLIKQSEIAMFNAKRDRSRQYAFYEPNMGLEVYRKMMGELELRKAIERNDFFLHYQPVVNINTNEIEGFECLIRWKHPKWGLVPPSDFIPLAEETGMISKIGEWVLLEACSQAEFWRENNLKISINASIAELLHDPYIEQVMSIINQTDFPPERLIIEITESMETEHLDLILKKLRTLKNKGIKIAMDDFGTGYSSLNYIKTMPLDIVKIDRTFINNMMDNKYDAAIIDAVIQMAQSLDFKIVAEGVETKEQLDYLKGKGITWVQGYYLYPPLAKDQLDALIKKSREDNS